MIAQNTDPDFKVARHGQSIWLMDLPDEVLINVMGFLGLDTLFKAKLVCKHFDDLADQFIYQDLKVLKGRQAVQLAHVFNKNPLRFNWVKSLLVSTKFGEDSGLSRLPPCIREMRNLETLRLETPDCNSRQPDERLSWIRLQNMYESIFEQSSLLVTDARDRKLPHLRRCTIHFVDPNIELYSLTRYASIFLHPSLRSLTLSCASTDQPEVLQQALHDPTDLERSTDLEHLFLEECDIHAPTLAYLLKFPRALKSFKLSEGVRYDGLFRTGSRRLHGNVQPHDLMDALTESCADSLESLSLSLGYRRRQSQIITDPGQHLNMTKMTHLKFVEVDCTTLQLLKPRSQCDHKTWLRLPRTLQTLKICNIHLSVRLPFEQTRREPYIPLDTCIIRAKEEHGVPNLTTVIYSYDFADDDEDEFNDIDDFLMLGNAHLQIPALAEVGNLAQGPAPPDQIPNPAIHNVAGVNFGNAMLGTFNMPIHPPQPPVAGIPPHMNNLNPVNPGNHNQAQQFLRQNWFTHANRGRVPAARAQREFTHLESSKLSLLRILNNNLLSQFRQSKTRLIVNMVKLPRGFIPPYLYPEDKPTTYASWWDTNEAKETETYKREFRLAREAKAFERNLREERERRRREEELQDLRQRIRRGEDIRFAPLPFLTPQPQNDMQDVPGDEEEESEADQVPDNDDDEDYVEMEDDDDDDEFDDQILYEDESTSGSGSISGDTPLFSDDMDGISQSTRHVGSVDITQAESSVGVRAAFTSDESEGHTAFVDAPGQWPNA